MGLLGSLKQAFTGGDLKGYPACPKAQHGYVLSTSDMVHFDLLDGEEECGGVEIRGDIGEPESWAVHVYGVDVTFPSLRRARAWLGKPELRFEPL